MSFTQAVADRVDQPLEAVEATLAEYGIKAQSTSATPVALNVTRLKFSGVKRRAGRDDEPFEFERELGPGLWAVTSEVRNLAGKSSVLFILRWALTGRSHLTDDVRSWLSRVEVHGVVGEEDFEVEFDVDSGNVDGRLTAANGNVSEVFDSSNFEEVMDGFFLDRLRLKTTPFWQSRNAGPDEGDQRRFGWTGYFAALHLRAENTSLLLGDQFQGGQPGVLMQVFLGLPWARTAAMARVRDNELRMQRSARQRRREEDAEAREALMEPLRADLDERQKQLAQLVRDHPPLSADETAARLARYSAALSARRSSEDRLVAARAAVALTQGDVDETVTRLDAIEQSKVVRPLLGRLTPTACPRCYTGISEERIQREADHHCSVCDESLTGDEQDDEQELTEAREAVAASTEQHASAEQEMEAASTGYDEAVLELSEAEAAVREVEDRQPNEHRIRDLEVEIARLEGRLEQPPLPEGEDADADELELAYTIVHAANQEAEQRRNEASASLLEELGNQITQLAQAFGMANVEHVKPTLAAQLRLRVGDTDSSFGARTGGEKLRLRLATVIAMLRVGTKLGVGRHPGFLLVDSPGGEEMVEGDVGAVLAELASVCEEMPDLQLICATARTSEVKDTVPADRIIHGPDYGEVW